MLIYLWIKVIYSRNINMSNSKHAENKTNNPYRNNKPLKKNIHTGTIASIIVIVY